MVTTALTLPSLPRSIHNRPGPRAVAPLHPHLAAQPVIGRPRPALCRLGLPHGRRRHRSRDRYRDRCRARGRRPVGARNELYVPLVARFRFPPGVIRVWGHFGALVYNGATRKLYGFCAVEAHSRKMYLEFTHSQICETFIRCHVHAFRFFGGVSREIWFDNLATAVAEHDGRRWSTKISAACPSTATATACRRATSDLSRLIRSL
jgi:transposase